MIVTQMEVRVCFNLVMGTPEEDLWQYYRWLDEQRRTEKSDQQVAELRDALGKGDGDEASRQAMRDAFCRQEEERLQGFRRRLGMSDPPPTTIFFRRKRRKR